MAPTSIGGGAAAAAGFGGGGAADAAADVAPPTAGAAGAAGAAVLLDADALAWLPDDGLAAPPRPAGGDLPELPAGLALTFCCSGVDREVMGNFICLWMTVCCAASAEKKNAQGLGANEAGGVPTDRPPPRPPRV